MPNNLPYARKMLPLQTTPAFDEWNVSLEAFLYKLLLDPLWRARYEWSKQHHLQLVLNKFQHFIHMEIHSLELDRHGVDFDEQFRLNGNIMFSLNIYGERSFSRKIQKEIGKNWRKSYKNSAILIITVVCFLMHCRMERIWIGEVIPWKYRSISLIAIVEVSTVDMKQQRSALSCLINIPWMVAAYQMPGHGCGCSIHVRKYASGKWISVYVMNIINKSMQYMFNKLKKFHSK